jgi:hypothetical protein
VIDRLCQFVEGVSAVLFRSSDIMQYPVWLRRLVLITLPVSVPLLVLMAALGSVVVYFLALIMSIVDEVQSEGVGYLFHAPSLADLYTRR